MIIETTLRMCCTDRNIEKREVEKYALLLDLIAGAALLIIGILAINGTIACSTNTAWALLGAGCCYVGVIVYRLIEKMKRHSALNDCKIC